MTNDELEGRLAALETAARIGVYGALYQWAGRSYPNWLPKLVEAANARIDSGEDSAAPASPQAREHMKASLARILNGSVLEMKSFW